MSTYDPQVILEKMLGNIPDSYAKTVGFPIYDLTAAFAIEAADLYQRAAADFYQRADEIVAKLYIVNLSS